MLRQAQCDDRPFRQSKMKRKSLGKPTLLAIKLVVCVKEAWR